MPPKQSPVGGDITQYAVGYVIAIIFGSLSEIFLEIK